MAFPIMAAAGGAARIPALINGARALATRIFAGPNGTAAVTAAARRIGVVGGAQKVLAVMRNNKLMTALVLMELGTEGSEYLSELAANDKEVADMIARYGVENDIVDKSTISDLASQVDEMACITNAANAVGGLDALHNLRRSMKLPEETFKLYDQLRLFRRVVN